MDPVPQVPLRSQGQFPNRDFDVIELLAGEFRDLLVNCTDYQLNTQLSPPNGKLLS